MILQAYYILGYILNTEDKINQGEHRSQKAVPHHNLQPETPKGMGQDTHTQTNRVRTHWKKMS